MPIMNLVELRDASEDRDVWRKLTMAIAIGLTEPTAQGDKVLCLYT